MWELQLAGYNNIKRASFARILVLLVYTGDGAIFYLLQHLMKALRARIAFWIHCTNIPQHCATASAEVVVTTPKDITLRALNKPHDKKEDKRVPIHSLSVKEDTQVHYGVATWSCEVQSAAKSLTIVVQGNGFQMAFEGFTVETGRTANPRDVFLSLLDNSVTFQRHVEHPIIPPIFIDYAPQRPLANMRSIGSPQINTLAPAIHHSHPVVYHPTPPTAPAPYPYPPYPLAPASHQPASSPTSNPSSYQPSSIPFSPPMPTQSTSYPTYSPTPFPPNPPPPSSVPSYQVGPGIAAELLVSLLNYIAMKHCGLGHIPVHELSRESQIAAIIALRSQDLHTITQTARHIALELGDADLYNILLHLN